MKFNSAVGTALLSFIGLTHGLPTTASLPDGWTPIDSAEVQRRMAEPASEALQKRTVGGIFLCTGENWSGTCGYKVQPVCYTGQCKTRSDVAAHCVTLTAPYLRNIGSFGPDAGATVFLSK